MGLILTDSLLADLYITQNAEYTYTCQQKLTQLSAINMDGDFSAEIYYLQTHTHAHTKQQ